VVETTVYFESLVRRLDYVCNATATATVTLLHCYYYQHQRRHNTTQYITYLVNTYPANSTRRRNNVRASVSLSTSMPS
jgi:hypothetical protein